MVPNCAALDGSVNEPFTQFYKARSKVGFMILGAAYIHPEGKGFKRQLGIHDDRVIPGLATLTQQLERRTRTAIQLSFKSVGRLPETFTVGEIDTFRNAFVKAAERARKCGFTAVELHACHDYWLNYFLSPHFNHRRDRYGGSLENRFQLLKETVQSIRAQVGGELLMGVRLSLKEFVEDGLTLQETLQVGRWLEKLDIDYINASGGIGQTQYRMSPPMDIPRASLLHLPQALKQVVSIPVIGVGRLDRPDVLHQAIEGGYADFAAVARALIADPDYAVKAMAHKDQEIRPCIACNFCLVCLHRNQPVRCAVNPYLGQDLLQLLPTKNRRKVVVVGGGPAGLSAAATAAQCGHKVKLFEKSTTLGGVIELGKRPPFKETLQDIIDYLVKIAIDHQVDIQTDKRVTTRELKNESADHIIIATGATPLAPKIKGVDSNDRIYSILDVLAGEKMPPGKYLIVGGGAGGLELAEFLEGKGIDITVIEMTDQIGTGLHSTRLDLLLQRIEAAGIRILKNTRLVAIDGRNAKVKTPSGSKTLGPFKHVLFAIGYKSDNRLADTICSKRSVTVIGDAREPRSIYEAIREGFEAGFNLEIQMDGAGNESKHNQ